MAGIRPRSGPADGAPESAWPVSYGLLAAFAATGGATAVAAAAGATRHPAAALAVLAGVAATVAARTRWRAQPGVAVLAWLFWDAFFVGRHGVLAWHGSAEAWAAAIVFATAAAGAAFGAGMRSPRPAPVSPEPPAPSPDDPSSVPASPFERVG